VNRREDDSERAKARWLLRSGAFDSSWRRRGVLEAARKKFGAAGGASNKGLWAEKEAANGSFLKA
jgi:hypothetical protein